MRRLVLASLWLILYAEINIFAICTYTLRSVLRDTAGDHAMALKCLERDGSEVIAYFVLPALTCDTS